jgi:hypothetical protein
LRGAGIVELHCCRLEDEQAAPLRCRSKDRPRGRCKQGDPTAGAAPHQVEVASGAPKELATNGRLACEGNRWVANSLAVRATGQIELNAFALQHGKAPVNARKA